MPKRKHSADTAMENYRLRADAPKTSKSVEELSEFDQAFMYAVLGPARDLPDGSYVRELPKERERWLLAVIELNGLTPEQGKWYARLRRREIKVERITGSNPNKQPTGLEMAYRAYLAIKRQHEDRDERIQQSEIDTIASDFGLEYGQLQDRVKKGGRHVLPALSEVRRARIIWEPGGEIWEPSTD